MGHVWLAHDQRLDCEVALKEIVYPDPGDGHEREARVARSRAEARLAAGLRGHPHVVTVHDVLEHDGLPWIVMEYMADAVNLRDLVASRGPLAPAECARIGLAVLDALTAGHQRGVMHRDVKPANILLAPDRSGSPYGRVLLTDYGISVQPDTGETRYTLASVLVGTAGYLAPERASGGAPTPAADLFSLGCTLYHAVEGVGPFERESYFAEVAAVVMEEPRPAVRAGALGPVLHALLAKDPGQRLSAAEAEAALAQIVTSQAQVNARPQPDLGSQPTGTPGITATAFSGPLPLPADASPTDAQADSVSARESAMRALADLADPRVAAFLRDLADGASREAAIEPPSLDDLFAAHEARVAEILDDAADDLEQADVAVAHQVTTVDPGEAARLAREAREAINSDLIGLFLRLGAPPEAAGAEHGEPVGSGGGGTRE